MFARLCYGNAAKTAPFQSVLYKTGLLVLLEISLTERHKTTLPSTTPSKIDGTTIKVL